MAPRTVYGHTHSSNGWPMVDEGSCTWVDVPGTNPTVRIQIQNGQPLAILRAFVADINAYVEHVRDPDTACWTGTNSVDTSNHLSATAVDVDWELHPFRVANAGFNADQIATIRELLAFYEGTVFWGNDWSNPKDAMHFQLGSRANGGDIDTFNNPHTQDFINRKIRADGFSTFRRGGVVAPPPAPADAAPVLARATGLSEGRAREILPAVRDGLIQSQCTNPNRIAMWLAQIGHESVSFYYTEEIAKNGRYAPYIGRTWIQITWDYNYRAFSEWCHNKGLVPTADYFVVNYRELADLKWAGIGAAWYWTVARPKINALSDDRDLVAVTQAINGGQNGAADRAARYERALALGDQLLALTTPLTGDDELSAEAERKIDVIYQELTRKFVSRSPLRMPGEGPLDTLAGFELFTNAATDIQIVRYAAGLGHPPTLNRLKAVANLDPNRYPDRADDAKLAQAILADIETKPQASATPAAKPQVVYVDRPADTSELDAARAEIERLRAENTRLQDSKTAVLSTAVAPMESAGFMEQTDPTTGQVIGRAYDALQQLRLADALPIEDRAPLAALISVLQTKNGAAL